MFSFTGNYSRYSGTREPETKAIIDNLILKRDFSLSVALDGGSLLVTYPYDKPVQTGMTDSSRVFRAIRLWLVMGLHGVRACPFLSVLVLMVCFSFLLGLTLCFWRICWQSIKQSSAPSQDSAWSQNIYHFCFRNNISVFPLHVIPPLDVRGNLKPS